MMYILVIIACSSGCAVDTRQFFFSSQRCEEAAATVRKASQKVEATCLVKPE